MAFCSNCGAHIPEGQAFCTNCGAKIARDPQPRPTAPTPGTYGAPAYAVPVGVPASPRKKSNTGLIIGVVAGVLLVALVFLVLFLTGVLGSGKGSDPIAIAAAAEPNEPETPVKLLVKYMATDFTKSEEYLDAYVKMLNGFASEPVKSILKVYKESPLYQTSLAQADASLQKDRLSRQAEGYDPKNYIVTYEIAGKVPLTPGELLDYQARLITKGAELKKEVVFARVIGSEEYVNIMKETGWNDQQIQEYLDALDKLATSSPASRSRRATRFPWSSPRPAVTISSKTETRFPL